MVEETSLARPPAPEKITLADGKEYTLSPLDLNVMSDVEDLLDGVPFQELAQKLRMKFLRACLFVRLKKNYAEMSLDKVGELVTAEVMIKLANLIGGA